MSDSDDEGEYTISGNDIYYYCEVNKNNTLKLNSDLRKIEKKNNKDINIYIFSQGGDLHCGLCSYDVIKSITNNVNTFADGPCCSSASILLLSGDTVHMNKNSVLLLHQLSTEFYGKRRELKAEVYNTDTLFEKMVNIYSSKIKDQSFNIREELCNEKYMSARQCLKLKLIDKII